MFSTKISLTDIVLARERNETVLLPSIAVYVRSFDMDPISNECCTSFRSKFRLCEVEATAGVVEVAGV